MFYISGDYIPSMAFDEGFMSSFAEASLIIHVSPGALLNDNVCLLSAMIAVVGLRFARL